MRLFFVADDVYHFLDARSGSEWISRCGSRFEHQIVEWADTYRPGAWGPCQECPGGIGWPGLPAIDKVRDMPLDMPLDRPKYRHWSKSADGQHHRVNPGSTSMSMCGVVLGTAEVLTTAPGSNSCPPCNRAVGAARAATRPTAKPKRARQPKSVSTKQPKKSRSRGKRVIFPVSMSKAEQAAELRRRKADATNPRQVPRIQIVSGGAPGLGKRR